MYMCHVWCRHRIQVQTVTYMSPRAPRPAAQHAARGAARRRQPRQAALLATRILEAQRPYRATGCCLLACCC